MMSLDPERKMNSRRRNFQGKPLNNVQFQVTPTTLAVQRRQDAILEHEDITLAIGNTLETNSDIEVEIGPEALEEDCVYSTVEISQSPLRSHCGELSNIQASYSSIYN